MRSGEALALDWSDIRIGQGDLIVRHPHPPPGPDNPLRAQKTRPQSTTFGKLGDGARGLSIAVSWLRSKYDRWEASLDGDRGAVLDTL